MHDKLCELLKTGIVIETESRYDDSVSIDVYAHFFRQAMTALREAAGIEEAVQKDARELQMEEEEE